MGILDKLVRQVVTPLVRSSSHSTESLSGLKKPPLFRGKTVAENQTPIHELVERTTTHVEQKDMVWNASKKMMLSPPQFDLRKSDTKFTQAQILQAVNCHVAQSVWWRHQPTREWFVKQPTPQLVDHFGVRTLDRTRTDFFLTSMGYVKQNPDMEFKEPSLLGSGYEHHEYGTSVPLYFVSEFNADIGGLDKKLQDVADKLNASQEVIPVDVMLIGHKLANEKELEADDALKFTVYAKEHFKNNYCKITKDMYQEMISKRADALAWICTNGQFINHVAVRFNDKERFIATHEELKKQYENFIPIQESKNGLLYQVANKADKWLYRDSDGRKIPVYGSFLEFVHRKIDPKTGKLYTGFDANNTTVIFGHSAVVNQPVGAKTTNTLDEVD